MYSEYKAVHETSSSEKDEFMKCLGLHKLSNFLGGTNYGLVLDMHLSCFGERNIRNKLLTLVFVGFLVFPQKCFFLKYQWDCIIY